MDENELKLLMKSIGESVRRLRKARGLSQKQLAKMIGRPQSTIARIEGAMVADTHVGVIADIGSSLGASGAQIIGAAEGKAEPTPLNSTSKWEQVRSQVDAEPLAIREWVADVIGVILRSP